MVVYDPIYFSHSDDDTHTVWSACLAAGVVNGFNGIGFPADYLGSRANLSRRHSDVWQEGNLPGTGKMVYV